jgi:hypothetical protein
VNSDFKRQLEHLIEAAIEEGAKVTSARTPDSTSCLSLTYPSGETVWLFRTTGKLPTSASERLLDVAADLIQEDAGDNTISN